MTKQTPTHHKFETNPFFITSNGITLLANKAQGVFILLIILAILGLFTNGPSPEFDSAAMDKAVSTLQSWKSTDWALAIGSFTFIALAVALVSSLVGGASSYTSARLARGHQVGLQEAFRVAFENLWAYLWLQIIILVKIVAWGLLFIIPGIIMAIRYSLASVAFFDDKKHLRGDAAVKESIRMTKNGWVTTYASNALFNILTLGTVSSIVSTGVNAVLYKQFEQTGDKKPSAHWLSWLTLLLPLILLAVLLPLAIIGAIVVGVLGSS